MQTRAHILVVEDDLGVAQGLISGLHEAGFDTSYAGAGDSALERILEESFDLVLLDLMLPARSGIEVLEAVRTRVSVPVIVVSARTELLANSRHVTVDGAVEALTVFRK
ncbi:MAG: response regulator, partial [Myxococcota bacterium]